MKCIYSSLTDYLSLERMKARPYMEFCITSRKYSMSDCYPINLAFTHVFDKNQELYVVIDKECYPLPIDIWKYPRLGKLQVELTGKKYVL